MNVNDLNAINEIKVLALDMIKSFGSGSSGLVLSSAPLIYTLYSRHLKINPANSTWFNRDRFILATPNSAALLYATLFMCGYPINRLELKKFGSIDSNLPFYPEYNQTPGVDVQVNEYDGIATAVGIALGERYIRNLIKKEEENQKLLDFYTYVLCSDNNLMNGITYEACSLAGAQKLDKLILLYDCNKITNDGSIKEIFIDDIVKRFEALNFYVEIVKSSENIKIIDKALKNAKKSKKPSLLIFNTILGKDSMFENKNVTYNMALTDDDLFAIKRKLNINLNPFEIRKDTAIFVRKLIDERNLKEYQQNINLLNYYKNLGNDNLNTLINMLINQAILIDFDSSNYKISDSYNEDMLTTNHKILNIVAAKSSLFLGGNLDKAADTKAFIDNVSKNTLETPTGRNIDFGSRELAAPSILNGLAILGLKPFCSTTLVNSDLMKSAIRSSALMNLPITYIFSNDSMFNENTPIKQTIEQLTMLRAIPNLVTFRPCDINEIFGVWEFISQTRQTTCLVLNKNNVPKILNSNSKLVKKGAYIIKKETTKLDGIIIATGYEVKLAINISEELKNQDLDIRVISMPSMELFLKENKDYQKMLIPENIKVVVLEPSSKIGWGLFTDEENILGLNDFGFSGTAEEIQNKMGYNYENIKLKIAKTFMK